MLQLFLRSSSFSFPSAGALVRSPLVYPLLLLILRISFSHFSSGFSCSKSVLPALIDRAGLKQIAAESVYPFGMSFYPAEQVFLFVY